MRGGLWAAPFSSCHLACKQGIEQCELVAVGHRFPCLDFFAASEAAFAMTRGLVEPAYVRAWRADGLKLFGALDGECEFERYVHFNRQFHRRCHSGSPRKSAAAAAGFVGQ